MTPDSSAVSTVVHAKPSHLSARTVAPNKRFSLAASPALYKTANTVLLSLGWLAAVAKGARLTRDVVLWFTKALLAVALLSWRIELANMMKVVCLALGRNRYGQVDGVAMRHKWSSHALSQSYYARLSKGSKSESALSLLAMAVLALPASPSQKCHAQHLVPHTH